MVEKLYCGYVYSGKPDVGGRYDSVNWFKWRTELLRELRVVSTLSNNTEAAEVAVIDVKGLRN